MVAAEPSRCLVHQTRMRETMREILQEINIELHRYAEPYLLVEVPTVKITCYEVTPMSQVLKWENTYSLCAVVCASRRMGVY